MSKQVLVLAMALLAVAPVQADEARFSFGGDTFAAGQSSSAGQPVAHDAFVAGYDVRLGAAVTGDAHMAGFNVTADQPVQSDLYGAGFNVTIEQPVGGDVTAMGSNVTVQPAAAIAGNARLNGANVTLWGPVAGSALIAADTLNLNSAVTGDLEFFGTKIAFGPDAQVIGTVKLHAPAPIDVPTSVAGADRVTYEALEGTDVAGQAGKTAEHVLNGVWPAVWATGVWWTTLVISGLLLLALLPKTTRTVEDTSATRPVMTFGVGLLTFAAVLGLVPVAAITIIGIVLLPFVAIGVVLACLFAYLIGVYLVALRAGSRFLPVNTLIKRVATLAVAVILAGLMGMVPVLGWLASLLLLTFGFGVIGRTIFMRMSRRREIAPHPASLTEGA